MAQLVGHHSMHQKVTGSIPRLMPGQGTCPGLLARSLVGGVQLIDVSLTRRCFSLSLSFPRSLKINKNILLKKNNKLVDITGRTSKFNCVRKARFKCSCI